MAAAKKSALVLFAHGARDAQWSDPFRAMQKAVSARRPDLTVGLAFLEIMEPALGECVARLAGDGHSRIVIAPLFLAQGGHLKKDLPRLLKELGAKHPSADISVLPPIGEVTELLDAISEWLVSSAPR
jgi:sirohydrochlorin cobaltochelatase